MLSNTEIAHMSSIDKVGTAIRLSLPHLPAEAQTIVQSLLKPETLAIIAGTLVVWAGSHIFGIGEVVDIILLGAGVVSLGFVVFEGAGALYDFARLAINSRVDADLEQAGRHFARAVTLGDFSQRTYHFRVTYGRTAACNRSDPPPDKIQLKHSLLI